MTCSVIITGASGFVARHVRRQLAGEGIPVTAVSRRSTERYGSERHVRVPGYLAEEMPPEGGHSCLVHLVGTGRAGADAAFGDVNTGAMREIIQYCQRTGIPRIVYLSGLGASSSSSSSYFASKYGAEMEIVASGLDHVIFRPSYILGRGDPLSKSLHEQLGDGAIMLPGSGRYNIQPVTASDAARAISRAISGKGLLGRRIDLVGPETITLLELARRFCRPGSVIRKVPVRDAYRDAIDGRGPYATDDLDIMMGEFTGDYGATARLCGFEFQKIPGIL